MARKYTRRSAAMAMRDADAIAEAEEANAAMANGFGNKPISPSEEPTHPKDRKSWGEVFKPTMDVVKTQLTESIKLSDDEAKLKRAIAAALKVDPEQIASVTIVLRNVKIEI